MEFGPLRQRILQLAISGQLVEQLESEPAVEQVGPAPKPDDVPFELPPKWKWVQLGALLPFKITTKVAPEQIPPHSWLLGLEEIEKGGRLLYKRYDWDEVSSIKNAFKAGDVLYGKMNPHLNKVIMADEDGFCSTEMLVFDTKKANVPLVAGYLLYFLRSPFFVGFASSHSHGLMPRLGPKMCQQALMPLPPFEEQRRIVAKIEALLGRLDQMETAYSEFAGPMTMHFRNLMLDKAIRGELVPQLDSEPEVEQVGPAPKPDEVPFELPPKWKWVPIKALFSMHSGKFIKAALVLDEGTYPCYGGNGIRGYTESFNTEGVCNIIGRVGAQCGNVHLAKGKYYVTDNAIVATHCDRIDPMCANLFLKALNLKQYATATAQPLLNVSTIGKLYYPLAPIEEQRRIVAKLDEVFAGVEKLGSLMEYA